MFDSKRNVLFYLQPSAIPTLGSSESDDPYLDSTSSSTSAAALAAASQLLASTSTSSSTSTTVRSRAATLTPAPSSVSASAARSRSASAASVLPPLVEELACADVPQWLRFCDQARRRRSQSLGAGRAPVGLEDGQRYGVLNRTVVEVQSICLPPSATSLLDPTIFPLLRLLSLSLCVRACSVLACVLTRVRACVA
jgi:hypothetical protein